MFRRLVEKISRPFLARASHDRRWTYRTLPAPDEGVTGEKLTNIDSSLQEKRFQIFPTLSTMHQLYDGVPYNELHVCHIKVSKNNTILTMRDIYSRLLWTRSCGMEGFRNARKGTNIAAQATAISLGTRAVKEGIKNVRVLVGGLGPGRIASIKGLTMSGLNIVSITDNTKVSWNPVRPRKARRV